MLLRNFINWNFKKTPIEKRRVMIDFAKSGRDRFRPRSRSRIFIGQPASFGRTSDILTATAAYLRGNTPATHLLTFRHAAISDIQLPAFTRHGRPTPQPHVGAKLYTTNDPRMTSPLRALLIPRGALFPCTQNALLQARWANYTDIIRGCKLSRRDRS